MDLRPRPGSDPKRTAALNLQRLREMAYPGRGILIGLDYSGRYIIHIYWIMGRSESSRNRVFEVRGQDLHTAPVDASKVKDPGLIIYRAMTQIIQPSLRAFVVSNGDQTDTLAGYISVTGSRRVQDALRDRTFEPDDPNFTPRITGATFLDTHNPHSTLSILRRGENGERIHEVCRFEHTKDMQGLGYCFTTYTGEDANPLPSFVGEPLLLPITGVPIDVIWGALNEDNRISIAMKAIPLDSDEEQMPIHVINKYTH